MRRLRLAAGMIAAAVPMALVPLATPASAAVVPAATCTDVVHHDKTGVKDEGPPNKTPAIVTVETDGLRMETDDTTDQSTFVVAPVSLGPPPAGPLVKLSSITEMSYQTTHLGGVATIYPAFKIEALLTGTGTYTTIVFEPIYQPLSPLPTGLHTWNLMAADAKFWSTSQIASPVLWNEDAAAVGGMKTWNEIKTGYPDAVLLTYGVGVGSGAPDAVGKINHLRIAYGKQTAAGGPFAAECLDHSWTSVVPTQVPATTPPAANGLPPTGLNGVTTVMTIGGALLLAGIMAVLFTRRRRVTSGG